MKRLTEKYRDYIGRFPEGYFKKEDGYSMESGVVYERLGAYEDLEEQGKLIKLPCAVGDTVYIVKEQKVLQNYIVQIHIAKAEAQTFFSCYDECFGIKQIGKSVFFSQEEAETALQKINGGLPK